MKIIVTVVASHEKNTTPVRVRAMDGLHSGHINDLNKLLDRIWEDTHSKVVEDIFVLKGKD